VLTPRKFALAAAFFFLLVALAVFVFTSSVNLFRYKRLVEGGTPAEGVVTSTRCSEHLLVLYEFTPFRGIRTRALPTPRNSLARVPPSGLASRSQLHFCLKTYP
jgi:hypothetical protein